MTPVELESPPADEVTLVPATAPRARRRRRALRLTGTLVVTALCLTYLIWKIDIRQTAHILAHANFADFAIAVAIMTLTIPPMAWRWQLLLKAKAIFDHLAWLTRAYFISYTAGLVLPTSVGGDAVRIYQTTRRHPGRGGLIAGSVVLERALGGAATLALAGVGFLLAVGKYDVGAYLWVEAIFVVGTVALGVILFSRRMRRLLRLGVPVLSRLWIERPVRALYEGMHAYRDNAGLLLGLSGITLVLQAIRVLAVWLSGRAVGIDLPPRPYYVMAPLLFLVMLVPFTVNGLAVRESFFVSFLGGLGVDPDKAFAAGFLFFFVTVLMSAPGALILAWDAAAKPLVARVRDG
jgi:glycosyltransferase 2 family protein